MTPYPDSGGIYNVVPRRSHIDDEGLRRSIDERVSGITHPVELKDLPGWREDSIMRILRRAQTRGPHLQDAWRRRRQRRWCGSRVVGHQQPRNPGHGHDVPAWGLCL